MKRLIDADTLDKQFGVSDADLLALDEIRRAPTVDAEVVVRCKDCRKFKTYACRMVASGYNDFYSYGERKSNEYAEG